MQAGEVGDDEDETALPTSGRACTTVSTRPWIGPAAWLRPANCSTPTTTSSMSM
jgi:hypothetical protein